MSGVCPIASRALFNIPRGNGMLVASIEELYKDVKESKKDTRANVMAPAAGAIGSEHQPIQSKLERGESK